MRFLSKIFSSNAIRPKKSTLILLFQQSQHQHFSTRFKSSKKRADLKKKSTNSSLDEQISQIISTQEASVDDFSSKFSISSEKKLEIRKTENGSQGVCYYAEENASLGIGEELNGSILEDVSPIVQKIAEIVRSGACMEERLEALDLPFSTEIVEKVLKRCFKVGFLALRFFEWVKLRPGFRHTKETYNVMLYIAGEAEDFDLVEKLLGEMDRELCAKDIKTWTILVSHYGKAKQVGKALWAFDQMKRSGCAPDKVVYEALLHALCGARKDEVAMEFYKEMVLQNMAVDRRVYGELMNCLSRCGNIAAVRSVGDDMMKIAQVSEVEAYACMLKSLCIGGKLEEARELFETKKEILSQDLDAYEILVKGLCRSGKVTDAVELLDDLKHASVITNDIYGCLIDGFLRKCDIEKALQVLTGLKESGLVPLVSSYTQIIQHLFRVGECERACALYKEMLENGIEPDFVAMTALVAGHVSHGHISEAREVFDNMKKKAVRPPLKAYTVFIKELCRGSRPDEAFELMKEMIASNMNVSGSIIRLVGSSLSKNGNVGKVREFSLMFMPFKLNRRDAEALDQSFRHHSVYEAPEISNSPCKQDINSVQISNTCSDYSDSDLKKVCGILSSSTNWSSMQEALEKTTVSFTPGLVEAVLCNCRRLGSAALRFFLWIGKQTGYKHSTETYDMAIKIAGSAKDFRHMRNLYQEMKRGGCSPTPNTWTIMISQYGRAGLTEIALKTFREMKTEGHQPNASTYKFLIVFLCGEKGRKVEEAIKIFQEMLGAQLMPDREVVEIYLSCLSESGKIEDATKAVKSLCRRGFEPQLGYSLLIKSMCRAGRVEEALKVADDLQHLGCKIDQYIYGSVVHALLRSGRLDEAMDKMEAMKKAGISQTVHMYTSLIVHFCKEKQIGKALNMFKKMREDGTEPTIVTYSALIHGYMNMGMVSDAWNIFRRIKVKGPFPDFEVYSTFMKCLCKVGRSEEGLQLIHDMLENGIVPSAVNFRTVYYGLNREGKQDVAHSVLQMKWLLNRRRKFTT